jgi:non-specific serine/threonine protein kinase
MIMSAEHAPSRLPAPLTFGRLPAPLSSFVGRERHLADVAALLDTCRLVTLTGAGGCGKTRLALEVARRQQHAFVDGVSFVPLGPVAEPRLVATAVAQVLGVQESRTRTYQESVALALRDQRRLLILDNLEHLIEASPIVGEWLAACPSLTVLVTSRERLRLLGEQIYVVSPLALPDASTPDPRATEAVQLFLDRAQAIEPGLRLADHDLGAVAEICRRLDGLPLAIELAAARVRLLPPQAMLARLIGSPDQMSAQDTAERHAPLRLLVDGPRDLPARQRDLRHTIAWSHDLLTDADAAGFRQLSVFVGGWTLEAAERVGSGQFKADELRADSPISSAGLHRTRLPTLDVIASLVDKSLVLQLPRSGQEPRFGMLETIREYALEQLDAAGERATLGRRHAEYFRAFAAEADPCLTGPDQVAWLARLDAEHANLVAALRWLQEHAAEDWAADALLELAGVLQWFWWLGGRVTEGRYWLEVALRSGEAGRPESRRARARALYAAGTLAMVQGEYDDAAAQLSASVDGYRALGDARSLGRALAYQAIQDGLREDFVSERLRCEESLALLRQTDDIWGQALAGSNLAMVSAYESDLKTADRLMIEFEGLARQAGDRYLLGSVRSKVGRVALLLGERERSERAYREALTLFGELRDSWWTGRCLHSLGVVAAERGDYLRAARLLGTAEARLDAVTGQLSRLEAGRHAPGRTQGRAALGSERFDEGMAEGRAMRTDEATAYALQVTSAPPGSTDATADAASPSVSILTRREREVARLVADGLTNREIAASLVVSERTVTTHLDHIFGKLGVSSRTSLATFALRNDLD